MTMTRRPRRFFQWQSHLSLAIPVFLLLLSLIAGASSTVVVEEDANANGTTTSSANLFNSSTTPTYGPSVVSGNHSVSTTTPITSSSSTNTTIAANHNGTLSPQQQQQPRAPQWMIDFVDFRKRLFLKTVEPVIVFLLGPVVEEEEEQQQQQQQRQQQTKEAHRIPDTATSSSTTGYYVPDYDPSWNPNSYHSDPHNHHGRRRLGFLPNYVEDVNAFKETSMSFATLVMLFTLLSGLFVIFLSCFYHNQKTSPLFISPRRHRLPKLVPPPLPVNGYFQWVTVCFFLSDQEIIHRIGYDSLIFLRFHRLALRCIVKMSVFSFVVLLPLNFTGGGRANAQDLKGYVGSLFFTDFLRFTMANVSGGSPRLWVHCFAAYLLTAIVIRELLKEYETFNSIRHTYLLSREPHLRTVLVTNIPRHLRSRHKINSYFRHVYPQAVQQVVLCQNVMTLEQLVRQRTSILSQLENELLLLCRTEKYKLVQHQQQQLQQQQQSSSSSSCAAAVPCHALVSCCKHQCACLCAGLTSSWTLALQHALGARQCLERMQLVPGTQERLTRLYTQLESLNQDIEQEQRRRRRVMKMLDRMEPGGEGTRDIDYMLAFTRGNNNAEDDIHKHTHHRLGLIVPSSSSSYYSTTNTTTMTSTTKHKYHNNHHANPRTPPSIPPSPPSQRHPQQSHPSIPEEPQEEAQEEVLMDDDPSHNNGCNQEHGVLRARSPIQTTGTVKTNTGNAPVEVADDSDNDETGKKSKGTKHNGMSTKARMGMQRLGRLVGTAVATGTATAQKDKIGTEADTKGESSSLEELPNNNSTKSLSENKDSRATRAATTAVSPDDYHPMRDAATTGSTSCKNYLPTVSTHIEDHLNEVCDKAFVVMQTFTAATIAIQSMHSSRPGSMQVSTAPEPRDILWENIYVSKGATRTRTYLGEALVLLIITFYVVPIALVSLLVSESALISSSPRLDQLDQASAFFSSAIAMIQPLCIVSIQQLLPPLFLAIGRAEGLVSFSEVQMRAFSRYFLFQVLNVFLVTTIAGSIFDTVAIIVENPEMAFEMLGNSLPRMSSFFITFVTMKTFLGLGLELVRTMALVQATLRYLLFPNATLRTQRTVLMGMRAIDDPGWFPFHKILAQDMLVVVISVVFAVVAPLVLLPCALFCLFSRVMWTHHHLYVYESVFESGGQFWPKIFRRFVFGLIIAQMTITGQFILKEARHEAYATIALMFMTYLFLRSTRARYDPTSSTLPLEVATVMDIRLHQEQQQAAAQAAAATQKADDPSNRAPRFHARNDPSESQPSSPSGLPPLHLGTRIGLYDPFENAYVQPALRANPRARPEQPFPPAQLGREDLSATFTYHVASTSSGGDLGNPQSSVLPPGPVLDTSARVRLKGLHQQDRRNINRWWDDQLQKCGEQNLLKVLIGEECGRLTISEQDYTAPFMMGRQGFHPEVRKNSNQSRNAGVRNSATDPTAVYHEAV